MKRLLREPLLHFLLIGAALFLAYRWLRPADETAPSATEIRLSVDDLSQLAVLFRSQWHRDPTPEEFGNLIEQKVQADVLYREALAMGLDKNDEIVRRRMAQKMQFLAEDVAAAREPTRDDLKSWFAAHTPRFVESKRLSFRHLYFSPDRRGVQASADAVSALSQVAGKPQDVQVADSLADPFMFQEYYRDRAPESLAKEFGPQFAQALDGLPAGSWQGPIQSGFGWHLVFVDTAIPSRVPDFEEIESDVKSAWLDDQRAMAWDKAYQQMRAKYTVLLPAPPEISGAANGSRTAPVQPPADHPTGSPAGLQTQ